MIINWSVMIVFITFFIPLITGMSILLAILKLYINKLSKKLSAANAED